MLFDRNKDLKKKSLIHKKYIYKFCSLTKDFSLDAHKSEIYINYLPLFSLTDRQFYRMYAPKFKKLDYKDYKENKVADKLTFQITE